ncbi:MYG1 family protein [Candidatus Nomurabacteria bacterium]|nr:MYG1 family protein [Candidatus Nomurabacteria bacterium]
MNQLTKKLITHDGSFHTDDIFACATLMLMLEAKGEQYELIRTREEKILETGDYVFDVGGVYDEKSNRFDHHQIGGAGKHTNGIEYASFGLVWKKFGLGLCGDQKAFDLIEKNLVSPIDAADNAISLVDFKSEIKPYFIHNAFYAFYPTWRNFSNDNLLIGFKECVEIAKNILSKEIIQAKDAIEAQNTVMEIYQNTQDKRIIVLDKKYPYEETLRKFPEPLFVIYPKAGGGWSAKAERVDLSSFKNKKDFPALWAGLRDEDLINVSGVPDAVFCHRTRFLAVAQSKEGAIKLAQIAIES